MCHLLNSHLLIIYIAIENVLLIVYQLQQHRSMKREGFTIIGWELARSRLDYVVYG